MPNLTRQQREALERLIHHAQGNTGQSRNVADFLLAWWNATECGGFDLTGLWGVDEEIAADVSTVFQLVATLHCYPDTLGYGVQFARIAGLWRKPQKEESQSARP